MNRAIILWEDHLVVASADDENCSKFQVLEDRGGAMDKISGMIPPPPTMGEDSDKEADEDDWD